MDAFHHHDQVMVGHPDGRIVALGSTWRALAGWAKKVRPKARNQIAIDAGSNELAHLAPVMAAAATVAYDEKMPGCGPSVSERTTGEASFPRANEVIEQKNAAPEAARVVNNFCAATKRPATSEYQFN